MERDQIAEFLKQHAPAHWREICRAVGCLADELEHTMSDLPNDLLSALDREEYDLSRRLIDAREGLSKTLSSMRDFLEENGAGDFPRDEVEVDSDDPEEDGGEQDARKRPDYSIYDVDNTVAYDIKDTPVTYKKLAAFSFRGQQHSVRKWKELFYTVCGILYKENPDIIQSIAAGGGQQGEKRIKMSLEKDGLRSPAKIPGSNIWLETNRSAADIRSAILILLERYHIPSDQLKVYFRRDYAALHGCAAEAEDES